MKKAAGQLRKGRRNKGGGDVADGGDAASSSTALQQPQEVVTRVEQQQQPPPQQQQRRKPTHEEAALTAKNYRLAKELSDLRVRHREECKTVSRLSMENMNLASRWREAINHVALLKKELSAQQRRTAEALLAQQQTSSSSVLPTPSEPDKKKHLTTPIQNMSTAAVVEKLQSSAVGGREGTILRRDVVAEMDRMDQILATHQITANNSSNSNDTSPPNHKTSATAEVVYQTPPKTTSDTLSKKKKGDKNDYDFDEEKKSQSMDQTVTPSPEKKSITTQKMAPAEEENEKEDFFAMFMQENRSVDADDLDNNDNDDDNGLVDDPPLNSVTPTESPPPSPPARDSPSPPLSEDDMDLDESSPPPQPKSSSSSMSTLLRNKQSAASPLFPMTASPKLVLHSNSYNEEYPGDITAETTKHPRSVERKPMPDFNDIQEEEQQSVSSSNNLTSSSNTAKPLSGIDAFEASFAMQFPDSFSPGDSDKEASGKGNHGNNSEEEEIYNPFFPTPGKGYESSRSKVESSEREFDDSRNSRFGSTIGGQNNPMETAHTPPTLRYNPGNRDGLSTTVERYQTPPHGTKTPEGTGSEEPKRPEKAGAAAARARYEKALQPRTGRRFPRRAEWESEPGASPVSVPESSSASNYNGLQDNSNSPSAAVSFDSSKLATAQARVKGRTALYTSGRSPPQLNNDNNNERDFASRGNREWDTTRRISPTDSVSSKPWDEEIGDIPMESASVNSRTSSSSERNGRYSSESRSFQVNGSYSSSSNPRSVFASSSVTRQPKARNRPWDSSNDTQQQSSFESSNGNTRNYSTEQDAYSDDSPNSGSFLSGGGRSRRAVKQPVSYAEPSLSAKLRRGDVFFAKDSMDDRSSEGRNQQ